MEWKRWKELLLHTSGQPKMYTAVHWPLRHRNLTAKPNFTSCSRLMLTVCSYMYGVDFSSMPSYTTFLWCKKSSCGTQWHWCMICYQCSTFTAKLRSVLHISPLRGGTILLCNLQFYRVFRLELRAVLHLTHFRKKATVPKNCDQWAIARYSNMISLCLWYCQTQLYTAKLPLML